MTEQPNFFYFECRDCGFDSIQPADLKDSYYCPLCADRIRLRAADARIEQLETALRGLYEFNVKHQPDLIDTRIMLIARTALAPEQDK
jgi:hypothetical protein